MAGSGWRLLAAFLLIFVTAMLLRGQDGTAARSAALTPVLAAPPDVPLTEPVRLPEPISAPQRYPIGRYPAGRYPARAGAITLPQISRAAGIIFTGRVVFVGRAEGQVASSFRTNAASTTVTFQVEHAIRGASTGQNLTIHEWAGLWTTGERYRVGERVLLFLYAPSKLGFTSPVAGSMGRFAIDAQGEVVMNAQSIAALAADPLLGGKNLRGKNVVPYANFIAALRRGAGQE